MMTRTTQTGFLMLFLLMLLPALIHAHGVKGSTDVGGVCVTASYDTDEAMSYAAVTIRPPEKGPRFSDRPHRQKRPLLFFSLMERGSGRLS
jgi:hypothetical protein